MWCRCCRAQADDRNNFPRAYRAINDAAKTPRSDVDLSPPSRSSARTACARSSTPAGTDPAVVVDRPMDTG